MTPYLLVWQSMVAMATYCINIQCTLCLVEPAQMALMCKTYKWALNPMHSHLVFGMTVIQSLRGCLNVSEIGTWKTVTQKFEVRISEEIRHIYCLWHFFIMLCICYRQQQSCGIGLCICCYTVCSVGMWSVKHLTLYCLLQHLHYQCHLFQAIWLNLPINLLPLMTTCLINKLDSY